MIDTPALRHTVRHIIILLILFGVTVLVFSPALKFEFLQYDDDIYILENPQLRHLSLESVGWFFVHPYFRNYAPVTMASHALDLMLWGRTPAGHHAVNIILHGLNVCLVYVVGLRLYRLKNRNLNENSAIPAPSTNVDHNAPLIFGMASAALLFGIHPLRVESVAWISDRKDLLCALFLLLSALTFTECRSSKRRARMYAFSLAFFLLAVLSKPVAVMFPVALVVLDLFLDPWAFSWKMRHDLLLRFTPFFLISAAAGIAAAFVTRGGIAVSFIALLGTVERSLLPAYTILFYLKNTVWPAALDPFYWRPATSAIFLSAAILAIALLGLFRLPARVRTSIFLILFAYICFLIPTMFGNGTGIQLWADRYSYIPTLPVCLSMGFAFSFFFQAAGQDNAVLSRRRWIGATLLISMCLASGYVTLHNLPRWENSLVFYRRAVDSGSLHPKPYSNYSALLLNSGHTEEAMVYGQKAIELDSIFAFGWSNQALAILTAGDTTKAIEYFQKAKPLSNESIEPYSNLGRIYLERNRLADSWREYSDALWINPNSAKTCFNLGVVHYRLGEKDLALKMFRRTGEIDPSHVSSFVNVSAILLEKGDQAGGIAALRKAAELGSAEARRVLRQMESGR